ncbi:MAG: PilZ domain-containing protein [Spirochaetes bacterium]|nr:PilZ domain-containing protein [Spirochaetota bacterium]
MIFSKNPKNNRAYPRADFYQPSYFIVDSDDTIAANECWFNNISLGGLAFESERSDLNKAVINVLYKIGPQLRKDRLLVKFSRKLMSRWRYGCQFMSTDEQRNTIIARYVDQKIKNAPGR